MNPQGHGSGIGRSNEDGSGLSFVIPRRKDEAIERTVAAVREACRAGGAECEIIASWGNHPTVQRNSSIDLARFDRIWFLDNDSLLPPESLRCLLDLLRERPDADIVGGPSLTPRSDSHLQRSFAAVLSSPFGVGPIAARYSARGAVRETDDRELILCNLVVRRRLFAELGKFDEKLYPNEENELIDRAKSAGRKVLYAPGMAIYRSQRSGLVRFVRQIFGYGRGRGEQTRRRPGSFNAFLLVPVLFLFYLIGLAPALWAAGRVVPDGWAFAVRCGLLLPLAAYAAGGVVATCVAAASAGTFFVHLPALFFLNHLCYALGLLRGLLARRFAAEARPFEGGVERVEERGSR